MLFDTHAHYDDEQFDGDREELLRSLPGAGVGLVVDPGSDMATSRRAAELAERYDFLYFAAGVHPHDSRDAPEDWNELRELASRPKCVAIGEIGLDYYYDGDFRDTQKRVLEEQLNLAEELNKPVIIHEREAVADCLDILRRHRAVRGVVHCCSVSWEVARELLDMGWYLSFTGIITYKNARKSVETVERMPMDRLMIETDSPYLAPVPRRGHRNSSLNLRYIAERVAEIRGMTLEQVAEATTANGRRFFGIG